MNADYLTCEKQLEMKQCPFYNFCCFTKCKMMKFREHFFAYNWVSVSKVFSFSSDSKSMNKPCSASLSNAHTLIPLFPNLELLFSPKRLPKKQQQPILRQFCISTVKIRRILRSAVRSLKGEIICLFVNRWVHFTLIHMIKWIKQFHEVDTVWFIKWHDDMMTW